MKKTRFTEEQMVTNALTLDYEATSQANGASPHAWRRR